MTPVDVAIPLIAGLLLAFSPEIFLRKGYEEHVGERDQKIRKFRITGYVLLAIAAGYFLLQLAQMALAGRNR